jgi:uncharacterized lipoprotein YddW (UPF0748 family)
LSLATLILTATLVAPWAVPPDTVGADAPAGLPADTALVDYVWVLRDALGSRASIDSMLARTARMGVRGLLVQVVGRGDACYRSDILPRAEFLRDEEGPEFDPLGEVVERAHALGLEVHAWVNCLLVWSAPHPPRDPRHVLRSHPEWIARLPDGRRMSALGARERARRGIEGVFLAPAHPGVREWLGSIAREIAERYPVDGIHLDYIRDPNVPVGFDPTTRARFAFEAGVDPARIGRLPADRRDAAERAWERFQAEQVTAIVRAARDSVERVRPGLPLSAAVIADTTQAERMNGQMWRQWIREGLVDRVFVMCYAPPVQVVMDQLVQFESEFEEAGRIVPGIAMYNTRPTLAALKIRGARTLGYPRVALYSYDSLFSEHGYWDALRYQLVSHDEGSP